MPEKKPTLVLAEEKAMSDEKMRRRKTSRSRSPPPPSFVPGYPADGPEGGIATAEAATEAATEAPGFLDKMSANNNAYACAAPCRNSCAHPEATT